MKDCLNILKTISYSILIIVISIVSILLLKRLDSFLNFKNFQSILSIVIGIVLLAIGFILRLWAGYLFYQKNLKIISFKAQEHLIQSGPYRFSRNPLYIGIFTIYLGLALIFGSVSSVFTFVLILLFWNSRLDSEEKQLETKFGSKYLEYKNKVPRWLGIKFMKQDTPIDTTYYHRFKIIIGSHVWRFYLRWAYRKCIEDFSKLDFRADFNKQDFTALLCGVGNETTADEFIKFVIAKNKKARIIIIDIGAEQIRAVLKLVQSKYPSLNVDIKQINALELPSFLPSKSIDWLETDGFLEYFDKSNLHKLLNIWRILLKDNGFITIREPASDGEIGELIDYFRILIAKKWLGVIIYRHTKIELEKILNEHQFSFISGSTALPTFKRYSIIKTHGK